MKRNFLEDTLYSLARAGRKSTEVVWVGSSDGKYAISWTEFVRIASFEFDDMSTPRCIAIDLVVVGKDFCMRRYEYQSGRDGWVFSQEIPTQQQDSRPFYNMTAWGKEMSQIRN